MRSLVAFTLLSAVIGCSRGHGPSVPTPSAQATAEAGNAGDGSSSDGASLGAGPGSGTDTSTLDDGKTEPLSVNFVAKVGEEDLTCTDFSAEMQAKGQIFTNIRLFVSNLSFVNTAGKTVPLALDVDAGSQNLQYVDADGNSIALLNFLDSTCAKTAATKLVKISITGQLPHGQYQALQFQLGLPYPAMDERLPSVPAALAPSDMGWMWQHYPADFQITAQASADAQPKVLNALTSTDKAVTSLPLVFVNSAEGARTVTVQADFGKLFATDAQAYLNGLESACNNNTAALTETAANCAFAYKALGAVVKQPKEPYQQTVFVVPAR